MRITATFYSAMTATDESMVITTSDCCLTDFPASFSVKIFFFLIYMRILDKNLSHDSPSSCNFGREGGLTLKPLESRSQAGSPCPDVCAWFRVQRRWWLLAGFPWGHPGSGSGSPVQPLLRSQQGQDSWRHPSSSAVWGKQTLPSLCKHQGTWSR